MNVLVEYLMVLHEWSNEDHRAVVKQHLERVAAREWCVDDKKLRQLLVRALVVDLIPAAMLALLQTPEAERLKSLLVVPEDDPKPITQALLVGLRRIRGKNARASFLLFCALRAVDAAFDDRPFVEWVVKAQLFAWPFFPARAEMTPDVYLPSLIDFVERQTPR